LRDSRSVEDFGAGGFIGLQSMDGVVQVAAAVQIILRAGN
jgi:hypothetical protein